MNSNRQQLLDSIKPGMRLDKAFFLSIYADEITWPGSSEEALRRLEEAGCSKAREYYNNIVAEYQKKRDEELRPIARQIREQWEADWKKLVKGSEEKRKEEIVKQYLAQKSDKELLNLLQALY